MSDNPSDNPERESGGCGFFVVACTESTLSKSGVVYFGLLGNTVFFDGSSIIISSSTNSSSSSSKAFGIDFFGDSITSSSSSIFLVGVDSSSSSVRSPSMTFEPAFFGISLDSSGESSDDSSSSSMVFLIV